MPRNSDRKIVIEELVKTFGPRRVVNHVSLSLKQGEIVGLLGPNGAGKSTTFSMIVGNLKPTSGKIFIDDKINITSVPMYKRARLGIGYLPQEASVFRKLSVEQNILSVLEGRGMAWSKQQERLEQLLDEFQIGHIRKSYGMVLSGGERRRVEIARCLAIDPDFILLDEPFAGVDPIAVEDIQSIVYDLREKGYGVLITDHSVRETLRITDRAYIMAEGRILAHGSAEELASDPEARRIYLGENFKLD